MLKAFIRDMTIQLVAISVLTLWIIGSISILNHNTPQPFL